MAIMSVASDMEIMDAVDAIMRRLRKNKGEVRAIFRHADNKISDVVVDSKTFNKHFNDFPETLIICVNHKIDPVYLRQEIKRYRTA